MKRLETWRNDGPNHYHVRAKCYLYIGLTGLGFFNPIKIFWETISRLKSSWYKNFWNLILQNFCLFVPHDEGLSDSGNYSLFGGGRDYQPNTFSKASEIHPNVPIIRTIISSKKLPQSVSFGGWDAVFTMKCKPK